MADANFMNLVADKLRQLQKDVREAIKPWEIIVPTKLAAFLGQPANAIYCASKWAIEGWAESIVFELEPFGIEVSLIEPGQICLPGGIPITLDSVSPRSMGSGPWKYHDMIGYTSVGAGSSVVPVRFNCPPEITLHHFHLSS